MSILIGLGEDPREQLREFVASMREAAPFGSIEWTATMWDLTGRLTRAGKRLHIPTRDVLWFTQLHERSESRLAFEAPFADFAKAVICSRHLRSAQTVGAHRVSLRALRYLELTMRRENIEDITRLEHRHFRQAADAAVAREKISSAYRVGQRLEEVSVIVDRNGIGRIRTQFTSTIPKSAAAAIATKMPAIEALEALGDVSGSAALYDSHTDLVLMRVVDILVSTGFRIGEVLSLPENPIVPNAEGIGLRYWPEKRGQSRIRPIATAHRELVERAIRDLTEACADARRVALWCEANPGRVQLPEGLPDIVSSRDVESLGLAANAVQWLRRNQVPTFVRQRTLLFKRTELQKALVALRDDRVPLTTGEGKTQTLGQSLIVLFRHELHTDRATNRFIPTWMRQGQIADFLGARDASKGAESGSVFKRRDLRNCDGSYHRITSHQFRHWLHTIAKRGGLSEVELARWMGRRRIADNRAYDHRTQEERVEEARSFVRSGKASGPIADTYHSLPPVESEAFLKAQLGSALNTPYGMCVHDYGQGPCERHFSCAGCSELLRRKGDGDERAAINGAIDRTRMSLEAAKAEDGDSTCGAANWVARHEHHVIDLIALLAVDDNEAIADGELVRVWPDGQKKAKNFNAE